MNDLLPHLPYAIVSLVAIVLADRQLTRHVKPLANPDVEAVKRQLDALTAEHAKTRKQANSAALHIGLKTDDRGS